MTLRMCLAWRPGLRFALGAALLLALAQRADAAHPLQTEDTATQGTGNVELENGLAWTRQNASSSFSYQPQIALGLTHALDLLLQPAWLRNRVEGQRAVQGFGDTNVDAKWRLHEAQDWSAALRSGLTLATSENGLGIPRRRLGLHALVAASWTAAPFAVHANIGIAHAPAGDGQRETLGHVSSALVWRPVAEWALVGEGAFDSSSERGVRSWPATVLVGAIHSLRPGVDVDAGYRLSFDRGATTHVFLLGFTWHFTH